ncbi:beta strand repeat-containing protein [Lichenicoccus sp.]|uniref:beta strand repeat-containing protein n=1 Tax=Lichenicoccus sp. TaxID=2781899 RepID=UPI003D1406DA
MPISVNDPLFSAVLPQFNADNPNFLSDACNLINRSPLLVAEIQQLDATKDVSGGQTVVQLTNNTGEGADSSYHSDVIDFTGLANYNDSQLSYAGGSLTAPYDSVTPASVFVGILGYELGHWFDPTLSPIYVQNELGAYSSDQATLTEFASEGTSSYDQAQIKAQIDASLASNPVPSDMAGGLGLFNPAGDLTRDTDELKLLQTIHDEGQAKSYLASQFWNTPILGGTFLSTYWTSYTGAGARNFLGIDPTTVTACTIQENAAGLLTGGTINTKTDSYALTYTGVGHETAAISDLSGKLLYTEVFTGTTAPLYTVARYQTDGVVVADASAVETITGSNNNLTDNRNGFTVVGNTNIISSLAQGATDTITGNANRFFAFGSAAGTVALNGSNNEFILGTNATTITGGAAATTVFGGSGALNYAAGGGTLVLAGAATITGASANQTIFSSGPTQYTGGTGYADVIESAGSATISAAAGGGWFEGGAAGNNLLTGSNSGLGTVLDAGGNGDRLTGGSNGGDYFVAGTGNETLIGGNAIGTNTFFLGSGFDVVNLSGTSIADTGSGFANIVSAGNAQIFGGTGQADSFSATSGTMDIYGYRPGTDHIIAGIASATQTGGSTVLHLSDGALITLHGVTSV